jgi:hypothetical protein
MRMTLSGARVLAVVVIFVGVLSRASAAELSSPISVVLRHAGADGLSKNLTARIEKAFRSSPDFTLASARARGSLVVTIPETVGWQKVNGRVRVYFTVEFHSLEGQDFGDSSASCLADRLADCANQVVLAAKSAANHPQR